MSEKYKVDPAHLNYNISTRIDYDIANKTASMQILLGKLLWQPQNKDFLRHFSAKARYIMQDAFKLVKTAGQATNFGADRPFPSDAEKAELEGILKKGHMSIITAEGTEYSSGSYPFYSIEEQGHTVDIPKTIERTINLYNQIVHDKRYELIHPNKMTLERMHQLWNSPKGQFDLNKALNNFYEMFITHGMQNEQHDHKSRKILQLYAEQIFRDIDKVYEGLLKDDIFDAISPERRNKIKDKLMNYVICGDPDCVENHDVDLTFMDSKTFSKKRGGALPLLPGKTIFKVINGYHSLFNDRRGDPAYDDFPEIEKLDFPKQR